MKIAFYTLGCKVNQYETQALKEVFSARGYTIVGEQESADVFVVNTCTVTGLADRKSRQFIRRVKKRNPHCVTAVIGCYVQTNPEEAAAIEGVDIILGTNEKTALPDYVDRFLLERKERESQEETSSGKLRTGYMHVKKYEELDRYEETGIITSMESRTRAFIKIQEGCDRFCSYCIIPFARGGNRSRGADEILTEAKNLIDKGFKEIVLTGINTALYGCEESFKPLQYKGKEWDDLEGVICLLNDITGDFRIRLGSLEPTVVDAGYAKRLLKYEKLCPHMHLSVQSGSERILQAMNRHYSRSDYLAIVEALREADPGYGLTTDLIVGFPGETEEDFLESIRLVKEAGYHKVHVFPYSKRNGTMAASLEYQIPPNLKKERAARLTLEAERVAAAFFQTLCGTKRRVLFEEYDEKAGEVNGFSDNYIRIYYPANPSEAESLLGAFSEVLLEKPYKDGIKGIAVAN